MKVLFLSGEFPPEVGGVGDYTAFLAGALQEQGVEVVVLTSRRVRVAKQPFAVHSRMPHWGWSAWLTALRVAREEGPDVVHLQYQTAAYAMHPAVCLLPAWLRGKGYNVATTFHDLREPYVFPKAGPLRRLLTRTLAGSSAAVVAVTPEDLALLRDWLEPALDRLHAIPIGSNILPPADGPTDAERAAFRARFGVLADEALVGYFGMLNESKGLETLLESFAQLVSGGVACRLLIIGGEAGASDPTNEGARRRFVEALSARGLAEVVSFTGHLEPAGVSLALASLDVCLLPYREGVSLRRGSLMAAMAHGCPIVTTTPSAPAAPAAPGLPLPAGERDVLLVPSEDAVALAVAARRLVSDPELRRRLGEEAQALARSFTWDKIARAHVSLYETLIAAAGRRPVAV